MHEAKFSIIMHKFLELNSDQVRLSRILGTVVYGMPLTRKT